jgi:hypothetical protein
LKHACGYAMLYWSERKKIVHSLMGANKREIAGYIDK